MKYIKLLLPLLATVLIAVGAYVLLYVDNSDMLFMAQLRSLFVSGGQFWNECMDEPGGLVRWAGCWLTQLFFHPGVGVTVLVALWIATFFALKVAYGLRNEWCGLALIPVGCLLASEIDLGYWIYYYKQPGYFFRESLGVLAVAGLLMLSRLNETKRIADNRYITMGFDGILALAVALLYPWLGYYAVVALGCLVVRHAMCRKWASLAVAVAVLIAAPLLYLQCYDTIRNDDAYTAGFPLFESNEIASQSLSMPFVIIVVALLLLHFVPKAKLEGKKAWGAIVVSLLAMGATSYAVADAEYKDDNYHAELQMYRAVDDQDWDRALDVARGLTDDATREIVMLKNVAVFNKGTAGNEMFRYNNMGKAPYVTDSLKVRLVHVAGPMIYMHHGKTNFAYRWCIENTVEYGMTVNDLKLMTQSALVNGEYDLARKYIETLSKTMHYKEWAERYRLIVDGKMDIARYKELKNMRELHAHMGSMLDSDQGVCEMYILNYFAGTMNKDSKYLQEMTLVYSLVQKDIQNFWQHFFLYANLHPNQDMPIHYQEAAYLYGLLEPQTMDTSHMPFDEERVKKRYAEFSSVSQQLLSTGLTPEQVGRQMDAEFGDTFWWFYFFCRGIHTY